MTAAPPTLLERWTDCALSLRLWVMSFVAWAAAALQRRDLRVLVREDLRDLRREIRFLIVTRLAIAVQAGALDPVKRRFGRNNPDIDRAFSRRRFMRYALRGVRLETLTQCRRVLDQLETVALRCARNVLEGAAERFHWSARDRACMCAQTCAHVGVRDTS